MECAQPNKVLVTQFVAVLVGAELSPTELSANPPHDGMKDSKSRLGKGFCPHCSMHEDGSTKLLSAKWIVGIEEMVYCPRCRTLFLPVPGEEG